MFVIYEPATNRVVCWAEEDQDAIYPVPGEGQVETRIDCTVEEFERACRESSGEWTYEGVGPNYLHDTVDEATKSRKTSKKGAKIGHKAVECEHPDNVPNPRSTTLTGAIEAKRKSRGEKLDAPVTIAELAEAEEELARRRAL